VVRDSEWGLLRLAQSKFDAFITVDQGIPYQQSIEGMQLALAVLIAPSNDIDDLRPLLPQLSARLDDLRPGTVAYFSLPR
jgi:hypothetical protein